jgi:hypothetical protein
MKLVKLSLYLGAIGLGALCLIFTVWATTSVDAAPVWAGQAIGTATPTPTPLLQPYPYTTPLPPPTSTILDNLYQRIIADPSTPTPCRRCAPFRVEGGTWQLQLDKGVYRLANQATGWRTVGSFAVAGTELKLFNDPNCPLLVGSYGWAAQNSTLRLTLIEDACGFGLRAKNLTHDAWTMAADPCQPPSLEAAISGHWPAPAECAIPQDICSQVSEIPVAECQALVAFYRSTAGPQWPLQGKWLTTSTPCSWAGLTCSNGHVTAIELNYNGLKGRLPPQLTQLTELRTLVLYFNQLNGSLPAEMDRLTKLENLVLHNNKLSGSLPGELGQLTSLRELDLESNQLSGPIPAQLGQLLNLERLNLNNNDLSGQIPPELGNLTKLRGLFLAGNQLSGRIPPELSSLPNLWMLNLTGNPLQGSLPSNLQDLPRSGYDFFKWNNK